MNGRDGALHFLERGMVALGLRQADPNAAFHVMGYVRVLLHGVRAAAPVRRVRSANPESRPHARARPSLRRQCPETARWSRRLTRSLYPRAHNLPGLSPSTGGAADGQA